MKPYHLIKSGISYLVYSNILVALFASAYTAKTSLLLFANNGSLHVNSIVFCAVLLIYCFHGINKRRFLIEEESHEGRNYWAYTHKEVYYILIVVSGIILCLQLFYMPAKTWLVFAPVALLGLGYTFPITPTIKGRKRLRDIYWLKTFWVAFAFSWLTTFLPVVYNEPLSAVLKPEVLFIFVRSLFFLFAVCIPFDIRDMAFDKQKGVATLPVRFGVKKSIYIGIALLLLFMLLVIIEFLFFNLNGRVASALLLSALVMCILLPLAKIKLPAIAFPLLYDSALFIQWIFLILFIYY